MDALEVWPVPQGGGWYELSDGSKVRGLASAQRSQALLDDAVGSGEGRRNRDAAARTLEALRAEGRLADVDDALVAAVETMAHELDLDGTNAALWRQYRETVLQLTGEQVEEDDHAAVVAAIMGAGPKVAA